MIELHKQLIDVIQANPSYDLVTNTSEMSFGGWGTFSTYEIDHANKCIELYFD